MEAAIAATTATIVATELFFFVFPVRVSGHSHRCIATRASSRSSNRELLESGHRRDHGRHGGIASLGDRSRRWRREGNG
jgi:hypothetical protein